MSRFQNDQAAGLRRIMAAPKPRVISVLSASPSGNQTRLIANIAASIVSLDGNVLLVHASQVSRESSYEVDKSPALLDVALGKASLQSAIKVTKLGYVATRLMSRSALAKPMQSHNSALLNQVFSQLSTAFDIVMVDASLNDQQVLPITAMNESEIIIQLTRKPESITQAYSLIKQICSELGRRPFGIIVDDASDAQAQLVFRNIAQVAKRFMQIELEFFGAIPPDDHISRAAKLGRSVIDAFPVASASTALKKIAQRLDFKHDYASNTKQVSYS